MHQLLLHDDDSSHAMQLPWLDLIQPECFGSIQFEMIIKVIVASSLHTFNAILNVQGVSFYKLLPIFSLYSYLFPSSSFALSAASI